MTHIIVVHGHRQEGQATSTSCLGISVGTRIDDFLNLDPQSFTGSDPNEDPQDFIDQIKHSLDIMHVSRK